MIGMNDRAFPRVQRPRRLRSHGGRLSQGRPLAPRRRSLSLPRIDPERAALPLRELHRPAHPRRHGDAAFGAGERAARLHRAAVTSASGDARAARHGASAPGVQPALFRRGATSSSATRRRSRARRRRRAAAAASREPFLTAALPPPDAESRTVDLDTLHPLLPQPGEASLRAAAQGPARDRRGGARSARAVRARRAARCSISSSGCSTCKLRERAARRARARARRRRSAARRHGRSAVRGARARSSSASRETLAPLLPGTRRSSRIRFELRRGRRDAHGHARDLERRRACSTTACRGRTCTLRIARVDPAPRAERVRAARASGASRAASRRTCVLTFSAGRGCARAARRAPRPLLARACTGRSISFRARRGLRARRARSTRRCAASGKARLRRDAARASATILTTRSRFAASIRSTTNSKRRRARVFGADARGDGRGADRLTRKRSTKRRRCARFDPVDRAARGHQPRSKRTPAPARRGRSPRSTCACCSKRAARSIDPRRDVHRSGDRGAARPHPQAACGDARGVRARRRADDDTLGRALLERTPDRDDARAAARDGAARLRPGPDLHDPRLLPARARRQRFRCAACRSGPRSFPTRARSCRRSSRTSGAGKCTRRRRSSRATSPEKDSGPDALLNDDVERYARQAVSRDPQPEAPRGIADARARVSKRARAAARAIWLAEREAIGRAARRQRGPQRQHVPAERRSPAGSTRCTRVSRPNRRRSSCASASRSSRPSRCARRRTSGGSDADAPVLRRVRSAARRRTRALVDAYRAQRRAR